MCAIAHCPYGKHRIDQSYLPADHSVGLFMPSASLEDRVHDLCAQAIAASNQAELDCILPQLQDAIRDHVRYVRAIALETIPEAFGKR